MNRTVLLAGTAILVAGLSACAVGPDYHPPDPQAPAAFAAVSAPEAPVDLGQWWRALGDARLDALVDQAVAANPDIEIALTHLRQAQSREVALLSAALPEADAEAGGGNGSGSDLTRGRVPSLLDSADNTTAMKHIREVAGFDSQWDLDLSGQYRRAIEAGGADTAAAAEARNGVLIAVIADVVRAYVDLRGLQAGLAVLGRNIDLAVRSRDVVKLRFDRGLTNELDLTLAERELATLRAAVRPLQARIDAAQYAIAALLGRYPETLGLDLATPVALPALPERIGAGLPLDLIKRRPDIRQAERELAAATARIGVATGNLFPHVALSGAIGVQLPRIGFDQASHIWSFGPSAYWPLLDFGAIDAQIDIADLQTHAQLMAYKRTVFNAVRDVDTAVSSFAAQQDRVANLAEALSHGQRAVSLAGERYDRGLTDYLNVVDAERRLYTVETELVAARQAAAEQFVAVFKNLGGGWEHYQNIPPPPTPLPALLAIFDRLVAPVRAEDR